MFFDAVLAFVLKMVETHRKTPWFRTEWTEKNKKRQTTTTQSDHQSGAYSPFPTAYSADLLCYLFLTDVL